LVTMIFLLPFGIGRPSSGVAGVPFKERDDRTLAGELVGQQGSPWWGRIPCRSSRKGPGNRGVLWLILFLYFSSGSSTSGRVSTGCGAAEESGLAVQLGAAAMSLFTTPSWSWCFPSSSWLTSSPGRSSWPSPRPLASAVGLRREEARLDLRRLGWSEVAVHRLRPPPDRRLPVHPFGRLIRSSSAILYPTCVRYSLTLASGMD
jgi:hypothetical protein